MSKNTKNTYNKIFLLAAGLIAPYLYFFTVRPQLINLESKLEDKITSISDKELNQMKSKLEKSKKEKEVIGRNTEDELIANKNKQI